MAFHGGKLMDEFSPFSLEGDIEGKLLPKCMLRLADGGVKTCKKFTNGGNTGKAVPGSNYTLQDAATRRTESAMKQATKKTGGGDQDKNLMEEDRGACESI
eukprot:EG_transcript_37359